MAGNQAVAVLDANYLALTLLVTLAYQLVFFVVTLTLRFDKVTDFAGGSNFTLLALLTFFLARTYYARQAVVTALVLAWSLRLALFLLARILLWGHDTRFDGMREQPLKLAGFWAIQAVWVWVTSLPLIVLNAGESPVDAGRPLYAPDYVGWTLFALGFAVEALADVQKLRYKQRRARDGAFAARTPRWCEAGVWRWSRHPNYFGEITLWWGVFIACTPAFGDSARWLALASPLFITLLLLLVSGAPMLERSMDERYAPATPDAPDPDGVGARYAWYKHGTSPLIPLPPAVYRRVPFGVKRVLLFEWPMYNPRAVVPLERTRWRGAKSKTSAERSGSESAGGNGEDTPLRTSS